MEFSKGWLSKLKYHTTNSRGKVRISSCWLWRDFEMAGDPAVYQFPQAWGGNMLPLFLTLLLFFFFLIPWQFLLQLALPVTSPSLPLFLCPLFSIFYLSHFFFPTSSAGRVDFILITHSLLITEPFTGLVQNLPDPIRRFEYKNDKMHFTFWNKRRSLQTFFSSHLL